MSPASRVAPCSGLMIPLVFVCSVALLANLAAEEGSPAPAPQPLDAMLADLLAETRPEERAALLRSLFRDIESGAIPISDAAASASVATACAALLESGDEGSLPDVARFLRNHPHPAAADALYRAAASEGSDRDDRNCLSALISLRDARAAPLLARECRRAAPANRHRDFRDSLESLLALGLPEGLTEINAMLEDGSLADDQRNTARRIRAALARNLARGWINHFYVTPAAEELLASQGFFIVRETKNEMYQLYDGGYPFVTADVALHHFMILMRAALNELERHVLFPGVTELVRDFAAASASQAERLDDPQSKHLARTNLCFLAVALALLDPGAEERLGLSATERERVAAEAARIQAAAETAPSRIFAIEEDYTKYKPRARHGDEPDLHRYFRGMLYLGRMMFRVESPDETRQALLLSELLQNDPALAARWERLDDLLGLFFGERDDLAFPDYERIAREESGAFDRIRAKLSLLAAPRVNSAFVQPTQFADDWRRETKGLRLLGQRHTRAAQLFQEYMESKNPADPEWFAWPPSGLFIAERLLGSAEAAAILEESGRAAPWVATPPPPAEPLGSIADGLFYASEPLFQLDPRAPAFMSARPWRERCINTALGAWAEQLHDAHLYAKDANTYWGASLDSDRFHGFVEPVPALFARLGALTERCLAVLDECGFFADVADGHAKLEERLRREEAALDYEAKSSFDLDQKVALSKLWPKREMFVEYRKILARFESLAARFLEGAPQSVDDRYFLDSLGGVLSTLALNAGGGVHAAPSMALISDPATEYLCQQCFEIGVGNAWTIYVAVPFEGRTYVCRGAAYSYTEFTQPLSERLDDVEWRGLSAAPVEKHKPWIASRPGLTATSAPEEK